MTYAVFSQEPQARPPFEKLAANASRFFSATLSLVEQGDDCITVRLVVARPALEADFRIASRRTEKDDLVRASEAEARGRAGGMAALAEKCARIWSIEAAGEERVPAAYLTLAAICASVALGPVLPPDGETLFGVRGAIERRDRAVATG